MLRGGLRAYCAPVAVAALAATGCAERGRSETAAIFVDQASASGLQFRHENGATGAFYFPEAVGAGAALFDFDGDGDLDVYLVQGGAIVAPAGGQPQPGDRLFRNDLEPGGAARFADVTEASGIVATGYGMGVATGDYDNDGWVDLYLLNLGPNQLWRNRGDGSFVDATEAAGAADDRWSVSASFVDFDRDGHLDLYVANYVDWRLQNHKPCSGPDGAADYCGPMSFDGVTDRLFRNRGDGRFEDVSGAMGILAERSSGLGVVAADFDRDGWVDIYVANDLRPNLLWRNHGGRGFDNQALLAGCAVNLAGQSEASMGVDASDFDNDGDDDLFMTNMDGEKNTLYRNDGRGRFTDDSAGVGLAAPSVPFTGFGTAMFDYDNDGWLDILVVNGGVRQTESGTHADWESIFAQRNQLYRNLGNGRYADISAEAGAAFELAEVSRGAAFGDIDNDGDTDVVVTNAGGVARLLINQVGQRRHWLGLRLVGGSPARDQLGAEVAVVRRDGSTLWGRARTDGSYASARDPRVLIGLGDDLSVARVRVLWPVGDAEEWADVATDRYTTLARGTGVAIAPWR